MNWGPATAEGGGRSSSMVGQRPCREPTRGWAMNSGQKRIIVKQTREEHALIRSTSSDIGPERFSPVTCPAMGVL